MSSNFKQKSARKANSEKRENLDLISKEHCVFHNSRIVFFWRRIQNPVKHLRRSFLQKYLAAKSRQLFSQKLPP